MLYSGIVTLCAYLYCYLLRLWDTAFLEVRGMPLKSSLLLYVTFCTAFYTLTTLIFWKWSDKSSYIPNSVVQKLSNSVKNGQKWQTSNHNFRLCMFLPQGIKRLVYVTTKNDWPWFILMVLHSNYTYFWGSIEEFY